MFQIAFPWFSVIGASIVFVVGVVVSHFTGGYDISLTGTKLISPVAHWLVPKEIRDLELKEMPQKVDEENDTTHWTWSGPDEEEEAAAALNQQQQHQGATKKPAIPV